MKQSFVAHFVQLLQGQFSDVRSGIVMEENWAFSVD